MADWQPIETAPKDGTAVLLLDTDGHVNVGRFSDMYTEQWHALVKGDEANWSDLGGIDPVFNATHWMPLPAPPAKRRDVMAESIAAQIEDGGRSHPG